MKAGLFGAVAMQRTQVSRVYLWCDHVWIMTVTSYEASYLEHSYRRDEHDFRGKVFIHLAPERRKDAYGQKVGTAIPLEECDVSRRNEDDACNGTSGE